MKRSARGFTLIELLIVVAIISILAAIAVPNFLEALVRAKVARVKSDFRALATGIEAYRLDNNYYPWYNDSLGTSSFNPLSYRAWVMTTPVAYITSVSFPDPFINQGVEGGYGDDIPRNQYNFRNYRFFSNYAWSSWVLNSIGPDQVKNQGLKVELWARGLPDSNPTVLYDPTNGTKSAGDIPWTGGDTRYRNQ